MSLRWGKSALLWGRCWSCVSCYHGDVNEQDHNPEVTGSSQRHVVFAESSKAQKLPGRSGGNARMTCLMTWQRRPDRETFKTTADVWGSPWTGFGSHVFLAALNIRSCVCMPQTFFKFKADFRGSIPTHGWVYLLAASSSCSPFCCMSLLWLIIVNYGFSWKVQNYDSFCSLCQFSSDMKIFSLFFILFFLRFLLFQILVLLNAVLTLIHLWAFITSFFQLIKFCHSPMFYLLKHPA